MKGSATNWQGEATESGAEWADAFDRPQQSEAVVFVPYWYARPSRPSERPPEQAIGGVRDGSAVIEAYERGYDEGAKTAEDKFRAITDELAADFDVRLAEAQRDFVDRYGVFLADDIRERLAAFEQSLKRQVVEAVLSVARRRMTADVSAEIVAAVSRVLELRKGMTVRVVGSGPLNASLAEALQQNGFEVERIGGAEDNSRIEIDDTIIRTDLPLWIANLERLMA